MRILSPLIIVSVLLFSCRKDNIRYGYEGYFDCSIHSYYKAQDSVIIVQTYGGLLHISVANGYATFEGQTVEVEDLNDGYAEWPNPNGTWGMSHIEFIGDSVSARIYNHDKFGYVQYKDFDGVKI